MRSWPFRIGEDAHGVMITRILLLGNSLTTAYCMPQMLAEQTGAQVYAHTRNGARLSEHLNLKTKLGLQTQTSLENERWDYVVLQEISNGPIRYTKSFLDSVGKLCQQIKQKGATPLLYATWAYQKGSQKLAAMQMEYEEMFWKMHHAYHQAAEQNHALIADVGRRFYELSDQEVLYAADGVHSNERGARIAAHTIANVIKQHEEEKLYGSRNL